MRLLFSVLILACPLWGGDSEDLVYSQPLGNILGSTHVSGRYYMTSDDFLNEGADQLLEVGMRVFKGWLTPGFRKNYPYNSNWPDKVDSLIELLQTSHYRELLDKPFSTYSFVVSEFSRPKWKDGLTAEEARSVEAENYELAAYLLTRYKNTSKTFILQNWEGDNALRAWEITDPEVYEVARQGMIDWLNARQAGIVRARQAYGMEGVRVVGAVEMTRTPAGREPFDHPLVVDDVVPHTHADLYSLSTWGTRLPGDEKLILSQLDYIREKAPASEIYGDRNLMLGEFGAYELTYSDPNHNYSGNKADAIKGVFNEASAMGQLMANRKQVEYALQWGVQYALYWELYCNGLREGFSPDNLPKDRTGQRVATSDKLKGVWLIRPDGTKTPTWHFFSNFLSGNYISDNLFDWSRVYARSPFLQRPTGAPFVGNQYTQPASLIYRNKNICFSSVRILHQIGTKVELKVYTSESGEAWRPVKADYTAGPLLSDSGWRYAFLTVDSSNFTHESNYLKVELAPESAPAVRVNKVLVENEAVERDDNRRYYRFAELDGLLLNGSPLEGFDPAVTRYLVPLRSDKLPTLECLPADPRLETHVDHRQSDENILCIKVAFPGEEEQTYEVKFVDR